MSYFNNFPMKLWVTFLVSLNQPNTCFYQHSNVKLCVFKSQMTPALVRNQIPVWRCSSLPRMQSGWLRQTNQILPLSCLTFMAQRARKIMKRAVCFIIGLTSTAVLYQEPMKKPKGRSALLPRNYLKYSRLTICHAHHECNINSCKN